MLKPLEAVDFVWDRNIPKDTVLQDPDGVWHIGFGTDLALLSFEINLTMADKRFLKSLQIQV